MAVGDWSPFLEQNPQATYGSWLGGYGGRGQGRSFMDYWKSMYSNQYMDYQKQLADMMRQGQEPNMGWNDYLKNFNFGGQWNAMSPWSRGERPGAKGFWNLPGY